VGGGSGVAARLWVAVGVPGADVRVALGLTTGVGTLSVGVGVGALGMV
jgi:hypothetical protein